MQAQSLPLRLRAIRRTIAVMFMLTLVWTLGLAAQTTTKPMSPVTSTKKSTGTLAKVDINSASETQIEGLGIDQTTTKKIIAARPFKSKKDLLTKQLLTADQYNKVQNLIVARAKKG